MTDSEELKEARERINAAEVIIKRMAHVKNRGTSDYRGSPAHDSKLYWDKYHPKDDDAELKEMWDKFIHDLQWYHRTNNAGKSSFKKAKKLGIFNHNVKNIMDEAIDYFKRFESYTEFKVVDIVCLLEALMVKYK